LAHGRTGPVFPVRMPRLGAFYDMIVTKLWLIGVGMLVYLVNPSEGGKGKLASLWYYERRGG
jgi:hypothetical protein